MEDVSELNSELNSKLKRYLKIMIDLIRRKIEGESVKEGEFNNAVRNINREFKRLYPEMQTHEVASLRSLIDNTKNSLMMAWDKLKSDKETDLKFAVIFYNSALENMKKIEYINT